MTNKGCAERLRDMARTDVLNAEALLAGAAALEAAGMQATLRDRFAMAALTGILARGGLDADNAALEAYVMADDMLAARAR